MKAISFCLALIIAVQATESAMTETQFRRASSLIRNVCQSKTKVSNAQIDGIREGNLIDNQNLKCYMECVLRTTQMTKDGKFSAEGAKAQASKIPTDFVESSIAAIDKCKSLLDVGAEKCQMAYDFYKCCYDYNPAKFILP